MSNSDSFDDNKLSGNDNGQINQHTLFQELVAKGVEYLSRREHSAYELKQKFLRQSNTDIAESALRYLQEQDAQSDERFAETLCRSRFNSGKGPVKLMHELQQHRIADYIIDQAMAQYENRWNDLANEIRIRKFGEEPAATYKDWARQARFLQQRGFSSAHIGQFNNWD